MRDLFERLKCIFLILNIEVLALKEVGTLADIQSFDCVNETRFGADVYLAVQ